MFKINISYRGKTYKLESDSEGFISKKIGDTINGEDINDQFINYKLKITGSSDVAGIPGITGLIGPGYHKKLLKYGLGMKDRRKGLRLRKTLRGEEISLKTVQINMKVIKEGDKKFEELLKKEETEKPA